MKKKVELISVTVESSFTGATSGKMNINGIIHLQVDGETVYCGALAGSIHSADLTFFIGNTKETIEKVGTNDDFNMIRKALRHWVVKVADQSFVSRDFFFRAQNKVELEIN